MEALQALPNIADTLAQQLTGCGIDTPDKLREMGSRGAWLQIRERDPSACLNRLLALEGAIRGIRWFGLPDSVKEELRAFYREQTGSDG